MSDAAAREPFRLARWTSTSGSNMNSRAAVVLHGTGHDWQASAEGNGAVDSLLRAVNLALADVLGGAPLLLAYDVHALSEGPSAEGRVNVRIAPPLTAKGERSDGRFGGEATSTNTVAASVEAYVAALNEMLAADAWAGAAEDAVARGAEGRGSDASAEDAEAEYLHGRTIDTTAWFNR
jgi:hypothetical protein